jgi:replicative DNA helicase
MTLEGRQRSDGLPPQNLEAEASVLGAIMLSREAMENVADILRPEHFYQPRHSHIYRAAWDLHRRGQPVDTLTVNAELQKLGVLEQAGGSEYLAHLEGNVGIPAHAQDYARLVEVAAVRRGMLEAALKIHELGHNAGVDVDEALDEAGREIMRLATERTTQDAVHLKDTLAKYWDELEKRHENPEGTFGVRSGFHDLDRMTAGFQKGTLVLIAARPSMGKTSLAMNIAQHAAIKEKVPVAFFSLEMSRWELTHRLLAGEANVDSTALKTGRISEADWGKIANAMGALSEGQMYIDDRPGSTVLEMRSKARRLKIQHNIGLVVIDYIQLMSGSSRSENRNQEVSEISRSLKRLAVELDIPVIALSQLSRASEQRADHRPQLSDLRESGCLTGDTRVYLPDAGIYRPIRDLVGLKGFNVLAVNPKTWKLETHPVTNAFATGVKPVFRMRTRLGREIRATANHRFLSVDGWKRLDELRPDDHVAVPRWLVGPEDQTMTDGELSLLGHLIGDGCTLPSHAIQYTTREISMAQMVAGLATEVFGDRVRPRINPERTWYQVYLAASGDLARGRQNPVAAWLREMGVFGLRSHEKFVPSRVFAQNVAGVIRFLRHLWSTDGCIRSPYSVYYATSSRLLARDVQSLLLRIGINAVVSRVPQGEKGKDQFHVMVMGKTDIERFLTVIGSVNAERTAHVAAGLVNLAASRADTNRDVIPSRVWYSDVKPAMAAAGLTTREMFRAIDTRYCGTTIYRQNLSRARAAKVATAVSSSRLLALSESDVYWDRIVEITPDATEEVYDLTVDGLSNFVADNVVVHNSLEQDSDVVLFIYREGMHNPEVKKNQAELMIAKHRSGETGSVNLLFLESQTRFVSTTRQAPTGER